MMHNKYNVIICDDNNYNIKVLYNIAYYIELLFYNSHTTLDL